MRSGIAVVLLAVLTACSQPAPSRTADATGTPPPKMQESTAVAETAAASVDPFAAAPAAVSARAPLPSCGTEIVERRATGDVYDADARVCFWSAWQEGRPAEFVSVGITVEAGHVTTVYRILADGRVETYTDWSGDPLGPVSGWVHDGCDGLLRHDSPTLPGVTLFEAVSCKRIPL